MVERHEEHEDEYQEETLATPGVIDKYQAAGKIANGETRIFNDQYLKKIFQRPLPR